LLRLTSQQPEYKAADPGPNHEGNTGSNKNISHMAIPQRGGLSCPISNTQTTDRDAVLEQQTVRPFILFHAPLSERCTLPPFRRFEQYAANNLLFNPQWTIDPGYDLARSDWPVATVFEHQREKFSYRETIVDRQTRFGTDQDFYSRRFDSTRTGRTRS
jgi:hypothetical protein